MIGRLFRTHDAVADFIRQATEFGWGGRPLPAIEVPSMKPKTSDLLWQVTAIVTTVIGLASAVTIIWVAVHFARKFW